MGTVLEQALWERKCFSQGDPILIAERKHKVQEKVGKKIELMM